MARVALAVPLEAEERITDGAERWGHHVVARCAGAAELAARLHDLRPDIVVVAAAERYLGPALLGECDRLGIRTIALAATAAERRYAAVLGLHEVSDPEHGWDAIERLGTAESAAPPAPAGGRIIAVWGPVGAPGRTTVAIAVAAELAARGHRVAVVDADTYGGSVAPALALLDESPGFAAACRLAGSDSLTVAELDRVAQLYESANGSFRVLTGIGRPARWPELSGQRVQAAMAVLRDWVDFAVLDTGFSLEVDEEISSDLLAPRRNAATLTALRGADHVIAVGTGDPLGLSRFLRAHIDLLETVGPERVSVLINRVRSSAIGMSPHGQVAQALRRFGGIPAPVLVPHDQDAADAALLAGRTLLDVAPRSAARLVIRDFVAAEFLPPAAGRPGRSGRMRPGRRARGRARVSLPPPDGSRGG